MNSFPSPSVAFSSLLPSPCKGKLAPQRRMSSFPLPSVAFSSLLPSPCKGKVASQGRMRSFPSSSFALPALLLPHSEKKQGLRLQPLREALFCGVDPSIRYNDRVDQRRGEIPSFVVSRMGSRGREIEIPSGLPRCHMRAGVKTCPHMAWRHKLNPASFCPRQRQGSIPLACFLFLPTFSLHGQRENGRRPTRAKEKRTPAGPGKRTRKQLAERRREIAFSPLPITRAGDIITCLTLLWL